VTQQERTPAVAEGHDPLEQALALLRQGNAAEAARLAANLSQR
jgi:hypothetical protein